MSGLRTYARISAIVHCITQYTAPPNSTHINHILSNPTLILFLFSYVMHCFLLCASVVLDSKDLETWIRGRVRLCCRIGSSSIGFDSIRGFGIRFGFETPLIFCKLWAQNHPPCSPSVCCTGACCAQCYSWILMYLIISSTSLLTAGLCL